MKENDCTTDGLYRNVTLNDVQLASVYYPILVDLARHKHCLTYGELVEKAKAAFPEKESVRNAIAVSTGRKLDVVRMFTSERGLPDLTCLVISKSSGECGSGFTDQFDPEAVRAEVFSFDWSTVSTDFDGFIDHTEAAITPRKRIKRPQALELMAQYYKEHKDSLPPDAKDKRELIIELLMEGLPAEEAFDEATKD